MSALFVVERDMDRDPEAAMLSVPLPLSSMRNQSFDDSIREEVELDMLRWKIARERAEELVRDRGWSEKDDDFHFQVHEEAKRQWDEDYERVFLKRLTWKTPPGADSEADGGDPHQL